MQDISDPGRPGGRLGEGRGGGAGRLAGSRWRRPGNPGGVRALPGRQAVRQAAQRGKGRQARGEGVACGAWTEGENGLGRAPGFWLQRQGRQRRHVQDRVG